MKAYLIIRTSILLIYISVLFSCSNKDSGSAVCVFDKASVLDAPSRKNGKWISSIALGEKFEFLGNVEKDNSGGKERTFLKVKLTDGKEGWVQDDFIALKSSPAVITEKIDIYSRPDLSSISKKSYEPMDVIALGERKEDWIAVAGKRKAGKWIDKGWIKNKGYSERENDIAAAIFIKRAISSSKKAEVIKDLKSILDNPELSGSIFENNINEMIAKLEGVKPVEQPVEENYSMNEGEMAVDTMTSE